MTSGLHLRGSLTADRRAWASVARLAAAADTLGGLGLGFDRARSLLWLGQVARRAGKRGAARRFLDTAVAAFSQLGCDGWAGQARADLARLGTGKPGRAGERTAAERRVAVLAPDGLANKEIARWLFISVHTALLSAPPTGNLVWSSCPVSPHFLGGTVLFVIAQFSGAVVSFGGAHVTRPRDHHERW